MNMFGWTYVRHPKTLHLPLTLTRDIVLVMSDNNNNNSSDTNEVYHHGGCHCKSVRFQVLAPPKDIKVVDCNCSICTMKGIIHLIVPKSKFIVSGTEHLTTYTFNTGVAKHLFCKHCGICPYYIPRSNPDGFDVNIKCFDNYTPSLFIVESFDGQNWEKDASSLSHLSKEQ